MVAYSCAVGFEGPAQACWGCSGHRRPGGDLLVLHQGRFVALCAMNLAGNTCNDDDDVCKLPMTVRQGSTGTG
jgi:hypothetical protein